MVIQTEKERLKQEYDITSILFAYSTHERTRARHFERLMTLFDQLEAIHQQEKEQQHGSHHGRHI